MFKIKNKCGGRRGCSVTIVLPNDGGHSIIHSKVHGRRYDSKKMVSISSSALDQMAQEKKSMETQDT
jgi:uncharacterized 2Fe-2S/4Fe-4S cluster protein (DUF4445 family)